MSIRTRFALCPVCNEHVLLSTARINESAQPFHEDCYVRTLKKRPTKITRTHLSPPPQFLLFIAINYPPRSPTLNTLWRRARRPSIIVVCARTQFPPSGIRSGASG